jgi:hypothetical protein
MCAAGDVPVSMQIANQPLEPKDDSPKIQLDRDQTAGRPDE